MFTSCTSKRSSALRQACSFVELLEHRKLLSVTSNITQGTLNIKGDSGANTVQIYQIGGGMVVKMDGQTQNITQALKGINIETGGGDDNISVLLTATPIKNFRVSSGAGNDTINVAFSNPAGWNQNDQTQQYPASVVTPGGSTANNVINVDVMADGGNDTIRVAVIDNVPESNSNNGGSNTSTLNNSGSTFGNQQSDFPPVNVRVNGGAGNDNINITVTFANAPDGIVLGGANQDGPTLGNFRLVVLGGDGNDEIGVVLRSPDGTTWSGDQGSDNNSGNDDDDNNNGGNDNSNDDDDHNNRGHGHGKDKFANGHDNGHHYGWYKNGKANNGGGNNNGGNNDDDDDENNDSDAVRNALVVIRGGAGDDQILLRAVGGLSNVNNAFFVGGGKGNDSLQTNVSQDGFFDQNLESTSPLST
ncbi:MAG TPA: hypothetical protein VF669_14320 [Tepidisphaeraceae bacterium]